jgi:hypothetical protein
LRFESATLAGQVVALATLSAVPDRPTAVGLLRLLVDLADAPAERRGGLADWGHRLYSGSRWWNPIRPDPLAEQHLADTPDLAELVLAVSQTVTADEHTRVGVLSQLLDELTRATPTQPQVRAEMGQLIDNQLAPLVAVCIDTADPTLALLVSQSLRLCPNPPAVVDLAGQLPPYSLGLVDLAAEISTQAVAYHRRYAQQDDNVLPDLAASLNNQSIRLGGLGRREDALAAIDEATGIWPAAG